MQNTKMSLKYLLLINKSEQTGIKYFQDLRGFTEYSKDIKTVYPNIDDYNSN